MAQYNWIESYLDFFSNTEPPTIFNRWAAISGISAVLGRNAWILHGHRKIYANQFIMLVGESGTRKSTAIKVFLKPILEDAQYKTIAASKTSKEKFLADLEEGMDKVSDPDERLDVTKPTPDRYSKNRNNPTMRELFGVKNTSDISECLIMSDDFNVFLGHSNIEFIELLTDLWDYEGIFSSRTKSGTSVLVPNPTLNILAGNTQIGISMAFPIEVIGQGFFSRLIAVHSEPSGRRITFPPPADLEKRKQLVEHLMWMRSAFRGPIEIDATATIALDDIYQNWKDIDDIRFRAYCSRRFTHLLKLCMCCAASNKRTSIDRGIVEYANTILHYAESLMPQAFGEFGKARHSDVSAKILAIIEKADHPLKPMDEIWPQVQRDLESPQELVRILNGLKDAKKIQQVGAGILPNKKPQTFDFPHCKIALLREYLEEKGKKGEPM
jgi:hypothetical protein